MKRILEIEGLRAYLALWVLVAHVLAISGYPYSSFSGVGLYVRAGIFAVHVFIIISGFVIFYLLDHKRENYLTFIIRRFFRIWPLFFLLFLLSIPSSLLSLTNCQELRLLYPSAQCNAEWLVPIWFQNIWTHIALHLPMLHGLVPQKVIPYAPSAFLGPGWSLSLEWQFYLIAPFIFNYVTKSSRFRAAIASVLTALIIIVAPMLPNVQADSFLPMKIEFFYLGCLSYYLFKELSNRKIKVHLLPIGFVVATGLFITAGLSLHMLPISIWILFFCQLVDAANPHNGKYTATFSWIFNNRLAQYLGKISYSIYLSHVIVIVVAQKFLLNFFSNLSQREHTASLMVLTITGTILASSILYYFIEVTGIKAGRNLAMRISNHRELKKHKEP